MESTDVVKKYDILTLVENYHTARQEIKKSYEIIETASKRINLSYGESTFPYSIFNKRVEETLKDLKKSCWYAVLSKIGYQNHLSDKRYKEINDKVDKGEMPEITVDYVVNIIKSFVNNLDVLQTESIQEAFKVCLPVWNEYKTNSQFKVGRKVILTSCFDVNRWNDGSFSIWLSHYREQQLRVLDNAFSLMDGKGPVKYQSGLVTDLQDKKTEFECETPYFKCKWYLNGNLHIEFKRLDLVKKLNEIGGKGHNDLNRGAA